MKPAAALVVDECRVAVPGGEVFVKRWTPEPASAASDAVPVVLLHDSLGCVGLWRDFPAGLAAALVCPVIAYDRLGFGCSSARHAPPSLRFIEEEAEGVFPILREALGLDGFRLFGHSVGGSMALAIAANLGGCLGAVSESAQPYVEQRTLDGIRAAEVRFARPEEFARLARWHGDNAHWVLRAWIDTWLSPARADWSLDAVLHRVACPVLAIHGEDDEFGSAAFPAHIVRQVAGSASEFVLAGCGHVPHREMPGVVLRRVAEFVAAPAIVP